MAKQHLADRITAWPAPLLPPLLIGAVLRLYQLPGQILLDDEWHALNFVVDKPVLSLFWRQGMGANCVPDNLYSAILLHTTGWSELLLRAPSVVCGLLALALFPLLIRRLWGAPIATAFAWLFAIAPCMIFYSRLCRPYAKVLFFGGLALLSFCLWMREKDRRHMLVYALASGVAVYFHLYATFFLLPPLVSLMLLKRVQVHGIAQASLPSTHDLLAALGIFVVFTTIFTVPPTFHNPWWMDRSVSGYEGATLASFAGLWSLLCGTSSVALQCVLAAAVGFGLVLLLRMDRIVGFALLSGVFAFLLKIASSTQAGMDVAIQIARYGILLFPIFYLTIAFSVVRFAPRWGAPALAALLFWFGPWCAIHGGVNNFADHSAFQYDYAPFDWNSSRDRPFFQGYVMKETSIPRAYSDIAADNSVPGVIEYPMVVGDHLNILYYYQHFHGKSVVVGYVPGVRYPPMAPEEAYVNADAPIDYVLDRVPAELAAGFRFSNIVALTDLARLKASYPGWVIVIHRHLLHEAFPERVRTPKGANAVAQAIESQLKSAGFPVMHKDGEIAVLRVPAGST